ncbi:MAG TPA: PAS domain S-box protein [Myxococcota bacterium]|nr:PAS domain S-box protein [Myxococcota bacterium]
MHGGAAGDEKVASRAARDRERYLACLAELSTRLLRSRDPGELLALAVESLREASGAERCYAFENHLGADGSRRATLRAESCAPGVPLALGRPETIDAPLHVLDRPELARGEPFHGPADAFPPDVAARLAAQGLRELALLPIQAEAGWWGTLGLATYRADVHFDEAEIALLRTAANAIGAALERAHQDQALRESEARFRRIAEQAFDLISECDARGRFLYASPSHEAVLGVAAESLVGQYALERVHPDDREETRRTFAAAHPDGTARMLFRMRHEDGSWRWIEAIGRFQAGRSSGPQAVIIGRDVTERRRLDEERARLEQAMDQARDVIVIWDRAGRVVYVNAAWERDVGMTRSVACGRSIHEFTWRSATAEHTEEIGRALREESAWKGRIRGRRNELVDTSITAVRDAGGCIRYFISVSRDVTREAELEVQLRQQQKLEAIGTLATGVAHDFNNLLTGVLGYAELLEKDEVEPETLREAIGVIGQAARRGTELTSQLLRFSPRAPRASGLVDLHDVVAEVVALTARTFPRNVEVRTALAAPRSTVSGDAGQLQQVLLNLVLNARDAMPAGGTVSIETALPGEGWEEIALRVRDGGVGIDEALRERIFEPFFTTKPREKGTGLGLAVAYGIVESHGGSIRVDSAPGAGATFEVRLPLCEGTAPRADARRLAVATGAGRVLVVDDEPTVRRVARRMLERLGYEACEAADGDEALLRVGEAGRPFDLVLLDLDMPNVDGRACLLGLQRIAPDLPVVLSTGLPAGELPAALLARVAGILPKPYALASLGNAVAQALTRRATSG